MVDCYRPVTGHDSKQLRLLVPSPTPDAGAYRRGHRNRLTWARTEYSITDGERSRSRQWVRRKVTFDVSRRLASVGPAETPYVCHLETAGASGEGNEAATPA
jgi:hypothetical protein